MSNLRRRARLNLPEVFPRVGEDHAAAIGFVAINWSAVEGALGHLLGKLLMIDGPAYSAVVAERSTVNICNLVTVLIRLSGDADAYARWTELADKVEVIRPKRNAAIHAEWQVSGNRHLAQTIKAKRRLSFVLDEVATHDLNQIADDSLLLAEDIVRFENFLIPREVPRLIVGPYPPGFYDPDAVMRKPPGTSQPSSPHKNKKSKRT